MRQLRNSFGPTGDGFTLAIITSAAHSSATLTLSLCLSLCLPRGAPVGRSHTQTPARARHRDTRALQAVQVQIGVGVQVQTQSDRDLFAHVSRRDQRDRAAVIDVTVAAVTHHNLKRGRHLIRFHGMQRISNDTFMI